MRQSLTVIIFGIIIKLILFAAFLSASAFASDPIRVLVWDEQQAAQKTAYGQKFLGETIDAHLGKLPGISVKTANPASPEQGLDTATLDATDVVIWWGHQKQREVKDEFAERVAQRVQEGMLGLVAQILAAERATEDSRLSRCQKWRADVGLTPKTI